MTREKCPSEAAFAKAVSAGRTDDAMDRHLSRCPLCRREWEAQRRLIDAASHLPKRTISVEKAKQMHDALLTKAFDTDRHRARVAVSGRAIAAAAVLLLLGAAVTWGVSRRMPDRHDAEMTAPSAARFRAVAHPAKGAVYEVVSAQPDELLRVFDGAVTVTVGELLATERFRVITGDAEVEVVGTVFEVVVSEDRLVSVRVMSGTVEVRPHGRAAAVLAQGERWHAGEISETTGVAPAAPADVQVESSTPRVSRHGATPGKAPELEGGEKHGRKGIRTTGEHTDRRIDSEALFIDGWGLFRKGDYAAAAQAFDAVTTAKESGRLREDAAYWGAIAHAKAGDTSRAKAAMSQYLADYPNERRSADIATRLGWIAFEAGDFDSAGRLFEAGTQTTDADVRRNAEKGLDAVKGAREEAR